MEMNSIPWLLLPLITLLIGGILPIARWTGRDPLPRWVPRLAASMAFFALPALQSLLTSGPSAWHGGSWQIIQWDGLACLMLTLVMTLGWIVSRFSANYLASDPHRSTYFRYLAITLACIGYSVVAGNLVLMMAAWSGASLGLHGLLSHYGDRAGALRGAKMKFIVSRLGEIPLVVACVLMYVEYASWNYQVVLDSETISSATSQSWLPVIAFLLALGAAIRTAQWPFHFWLPETLETPTPVSALMHAGIVNAGGYLMIRTSPILQASPTALYLLAGLGFVTALLGGLSMLTQTSVKRSLAFSTVSQMGFMMLQCGLGAFGAATLHLLGHSLYKAYAFLTSGTVMSQASGMAIVNAKGSSPQLPSLASLAIAASWTVLACGAATWICGIDLLVKPGGIFLGGLLCLGLTKRLWQLLTSSGRTSLPSGLVTTFALALAYAFAFRWIQAWAVPESVIPATLSGPSLLVSALLLLPFVGLFAWESSSSARSQSFPLWNACYTHAANGFYVDVLARRLVRAMTT